MCAFQGALDAPSNDEEKMECFQHSSHSTPFFISRVEWTVYHGRVGQGDGVVEDAGGGSPLDNVVEG